MSTQSPNIPFDANEFAGKRVLVTGGTKGIGEAIVTRLLGGGATVLAAARTVPADGNSEHLIQADVSTRAGADHISQRPPVKPEAWGCEPLKAAVVVCRS